MYRRVVGFGAYGASFANPNGLPMNCAPGYSMLQPTCYLAPQCLTPDEFAAANAQCLIPPVGPVGPANPAPVDSSGSGTSSGSSGAGSGASSGSSAGSGASGSGSSGGAVPVPGIPRSYLLIAAGALALLLVVKS